MRRKLFFITPLVLVLALSGLATAAAEEGYIDDPNYNLSFEYDVNGQQIYCKVTYLDTVLAWNDNGVDFATVEIDCDDSLGTPGCICKDDNSTDGLTRLTMGQYGSDSNLIVWQSLNPTFDANAVIQENYLYRVYYDTFKWENNTLKAYLFYGNIPGPNTSENADVNVIVEDEPAVTSEYQTFSIEFAALSGQPYIGQPLGIRFLQRGYGWHWIDNIRVYYTVLTKAWDPEPADGAENVPKNVTLNWIPGVYTQDVNGHEIYFGTSWSDVNSATTATAGIYRRAQDRDVNSYTPPECPLGLGRSYFWRIDEVNSTTLWKGNVWTFDIEGFATNPYPGDGAAEVPKNVILRWTAGAESKWHDVYFGTSDSAVTAATTASPEYKTRTNLGTELYDAGTNENPQVGEQYFWRIDEVNTITVKGHVWDFTVANYILIDDFDFYANHTELRAVWKDYYSAIGGDGVVWVNKDANYVVDGNSMLFEYWNNASPYYSETRRDYSTAQDWSYSGNGVTALEIDFFGDVNNTPDPPMYVKLSDGTTSATVNYPDFNEALEEEVHTWNIPLKDFSGVTLSNITSITLGIGDKARELGPPDEEGTVYFDDIRVLPPRCYPEYGPAADFTNDCTVDMDDLTILIQDWCKSGGWGLPGLPALPPVVEYLYSEGSGDTIDNTGTYGSSHDLTLHMGVDANHVLTIDPNNNPVWTNDADPCRGWNLWFDGEVGHLLTGATKDWPYAMGGDYLPMPALNLNSNTVTLATWIKPDPCLINGDYHQYTGFTGLIHSREGSTAGMAYSGDGAAYTGELGYTWNDDDEDTWSFDSNIAIPDFQWSMIAVVIEPENATLYLVDTNNTADHNDDALLSATNAIAHNPEPWGGHFACIAADGGYVNGLGGWQTRALRGQLDGTRVYDYSLTLNEILGLGEMKQKIYIPLNSPVDLCVGNKNPTDPCAPVDDQIDLCDYSKFADEWLETKLWPEP